MTLDDWKTLKNFSISDSFGDSLKMQLSLMQELDSFASYLQTKIVVTSGTQGAHLENSEHYEGFAVDVMVPQYRSKYPLFDLYTAASRFKFQSIGVYPDWKLSGIKWGGLHLGMRAHEYRALWMGVLNNGRQEYIGLNAVNLKSYAVL